MRIGIFGQALTVDDLVEQARKVHERRFASFWTPQIFDLDALTALAVVGREVPELELGTAVVPTYPRHPMVMAGQARTVQQVSGGRLTLGIGLSHQIVIEGMLGLDFAKPVRHLREYLDILLPLVHDEVADARGDTLTATNVGITIPDSTPVPVVVAALGPQLLRLAGGRTDGTVTWMTGPRTIADHVAPSIRAAAAEAGRPEPRVVCALPVAVTDDEAASRRRAGAYFQVYGFLPSYRAMLDREGAEGPADVAIVGTADEVRAAVAAVFEAGATEFVGVPFPGDDATLDVLAGLAAD
jgi:F420-dependent oxidoreductase-like protein